MQCAQCNARLSKKAQSCPRCGASVVATPEFQVDQNVTAARDNAGINVGNIINSTGVAIGNGAQVTVVYQGKPVLIPSSDDFAAHRAALAEKPEYKQWAGAFYMAETGKSLPLYASPYDDEKSRRNERRDLLETIRTHERLLILGEPGMGKTVALQRMMWETAARAEPALTPIFVPLNDFRGDLLEPVRVALRETGVLRLEDAQSVRACLDRERCLILFDGLNETPGKWRSEVVAALGKFMREFPSQRYVVTSRLQDPLWDKLRALEVIPETIVIQAITTEQIRAYLVAHLGKAQGAALYKRLNERLLELARTPLLLWMIQKIGQDTPELPKNRGGLFELFVEWILEREKKLETETPPETQKRALRRLAFSLHNEHRLVCPRAYAEQLVTEAAGKYAPETVVQEALVHHLLEPAQATDDPQVKFAHQFFQEYFASLDLDLALQAEKHMPGWLRWRLGNRRLAARARDSWWMETFVQLAGLTGDADWLVMELTRTGSSFLAWWCIDEGGQVSEVTRQKVEQNSVGLLKASKPADRRRAVTALMRVDSDRVLPLLLFAAGDEEASVFNLALQALLERKEIAQPVIKQALESEDRRLRRAALRYLASQPDIALIKQIPWKKILGQPMVWVPPGPFLMGSDKMKDPKAYDGELPQHTVELPGYWIGRTPVTVAQWRVFVNEGGHKPEHTESLQGPDDHPVRYVNWREAMAYCRWWSEKSGLPVSLPSEAEWEKAARGTDGRIYPWGDEFNPQKCNMRESGIGTTSPVGKYSAAGGDSPYGCADMAGNVWEWTRSKVGPYPYHAQDGRESLEGAAARVLRGGSFSYKRRLVRCAYRSGRVPSPWSDNFGFRVGVVSPIFVSDLRNSEY